MEKRLALVLAGVLAICSLTACDGETPTESQLREQIAKLESELSSVSDNSTSTENSEIVGSNINDSQPEQNEPKSDYPDMFDVLPAIEETPISKFEYEYDAKMEGMRITNYLGQSPKVRVPNIIEGEPVVAVNTGDVQITHLYLPDTVHEVNCVEEFLKYVNIPSSYDERSRTGDILTFWADNIESVYLNYGVTEITHGEFDGCVNLTTISIPNTVTEIGDYAFSNCSGLSSITIPNGVKKIGEWSFQECTNLTNITLSDQITEIGNYAFVYCGSLNEINIPKQISRIGESAFSNCSNLTNVNLPDGISEIGENAFSNCTGLKSITIPGSVSRINEGTFLNCNNLTELTLMNGIKEIEYEAFSDCGKLISVTIPETVTQLGKRAFANCFSMERAVIPDSINSIDDSNHTSDYSGATDLESIHQIVNDVFQNCFNVAVSYMGDTYKYQDIVDTNENSNNYNFVMNGTVLKKCDDSIHGTVIIPNSVTEIGREAFLNCTNITSVYIPNSVTTIGNNAFADCKALSNIIIPDSVTLIGTGAFLRCTSLANISLPDSITILFGCFCGSGITSITIPNSVTEINGSFTGCTELSSVTIPNSVIRIVDRAFSNCTKLSSLTIPDSVTELQEGSFRDCQNIVINYKEKSFTYDERFKLYDYVAYPNGYVIEDDMLVKYPCYLEGDFVIPDGVKTIAAKAFKHCSGINITSPDSLTKITFNAFENCNGINITIPDSLTKLNKSAFQGCENITVTYKGKAYTLDQIDDLYAAING